MSIIVPWKLNNKDRYGIFRKKGKEDTYMIKCSVWKNDGFKEIDLNDKKIEFKKRMVVFLDVLGFKAKLQHSDQFKIAETYQALLNIIYNAKENMDKNGRDLFDLYVFSDSIVLIAKDDSNKAIAELISATWKFMQFSIGARMPFRGGISYGDIYTNEKESIFLGNPIVQAVKMEGEQEWIGISCDEYAKERLNVITEQDSNWENIVPNILMIDYDVPLKSGKYDKKRVVNWRFNLVAEEGIKSLFENEFNREDVKIKIENTLKFAKYVKESGKVYIANSVKESIKERCGVLYLGKSQPPFKNGDEY